MLVTVFLLGTFIWERPVQRALEDIISVGAIQRIRRYSLTLLPGADHYFPHQPTGRIAVNGLLDVGTRSSWRGVISTTASAVLTVNCIVGGTGVTFGLHEGGLATAASIGVGVLSGLVLFAALASHQIRQFTRVKAAVAAAAGSAAPGGVGPVISRT